MDSKSRIGPVESPERQEEANKLYEDGLTQQFKNLIEEKALPKDNTEKPKEKPKAGDAPTGRMTARTPLASLIILLKWRTL
jgi:hypothetical protein